MCVPYLQFKNPDYYQWWWMWSVFLFCFLLHHVAHESLERSYLKLRGAAPASALLKLLEEILGKTHKHLHKSWCINTVGGTWER